MDAGCGPSDITARQRPQGLGRPLVLASTPRPGQSSHMGPSQAISAPFAPRFLQDVFLLLKHLNKVQRLQEPKIKPKPAHRQPAPVASPPTPLPYWLNHIRNGGKIKSVLYFCCLGRDFLKGTGKKSLTLREFKGMFLGKRVFQISSWLKRKSCSGLKGDNDSKESCFYMAH